MTTRISVVVPTYKRPPLLDRCLTALLAQDLPAHAFEIVVADDGNEPAVRRLVAQRRCSIGAHPRLRYVPVRGRHGPAAARNCGWRAARGDIIAFTDDDCIPAPDWLRCGLAAFKRGTVAVWGRVVVPLPPDPTDYERDAAGLQSAGFVTANCFCRRATLAAVGGLDEEFTAAWREDSDLYFTLLERGDRVARARHALVTHPVRPAPWGTSVRQQRKILFDALLYKKHPRLYRTFIRRSPPWRYYGILAAIVACIVAGAAQYPVLAAAAAAVWTALTAHLVIARLRDTSRRPLHVAEMALTSLLIPPLAVFWRLVGAVRFRVMFF